MDQLEHMNNVAVVVARIKPKVSEIIRKYGEIMESEKTLTFTPSCTKNLILTSLITLYILMDSSFWFYTINLG